MDAPGIRTTPCRFGFGSAGVGRSDAVDAGASLRVGLKRLRLATTAYAAAPPPGAAGAAGRSAAASAGGRARTGIDFDAIDKKPTYLFFALVSPENSAGLHLKALARISRLFKNASFRESILQAASVEQIYALITQEDAKV